MLPIFLWISIFKVVVVENELFILEASHSVCEWIIKFVTITMIELFCIFLGTGTATTKNCCKNKHTDPGTHKHYVMDAK